jgi:LysM repeat protein
MERERRTKTTQKKPSAKTPPLPQKEQIDVETKAHKVQAGDSLYRISLQYGLSIELLRDYNNLEPNATIYPGQEIKLTP